jgi:hypothetical protein
MHTTTLSGDIGAVGTATDNVYHVVTGANNATIDGFTITSGQADGASPYCMGGGMYNNAVSPTVSNCIFTTNVAGATGGNKYVYGGGIYNYGGSPTVTNCTFTTNTASGGLYPSGGGIYSESGSPTVSNCTFTANFVGNGGYAYGGALCIKGGSAVVSNSIFTNNTSSSTNYDADGGALYLNTGTATVANCTFAKNTGKAGGGVYSETGSTLTLFNSIVWGNSDTSTGTYAGIYNNGGTIAVSYSDIEGTSVFTGTGNIMKDPLFANSSLGDFHLRSDSPCVDAAYGGTSTPTLDIAGNPRVDVSSVANTGQGTPAYVDMGAYEYQGS